MSKKVNSEHDTLTYKQPEIISPVPIDLEREKEKQEIRKEAKALRKKLGNIEAVVITKNGSVKKATELLLEEQEDEIVKCATNPIYFIETYLTIFDQTQPNGGAIVPFKLFDFQRDLIDEYQNHRYVVANKYRQAGVSTTTCAYIAWYVMFNENRQVAIVADKLETARDELMYDVVEFIESCPVWLRPKTGRDSSRNLKDTQKLKQYDNGSRLGAFSSKGLRGMTPTLLFWDETAWTEKGDVFWTAAKPALQTGGGAILVSTPNSQDAVFYKTFAAAKNDENHQFKAVELWWFNDPRYNQGLKWYKNKGRENEIEMVDEGWSNKKRIQLMDDGWEATSPWLESEIRGANNDMRKIAQEILCVFGDSIITIRNKKTGMVESLPIRDFYERLENDNLKLNKFY